MVKALIPEAAVIAVETADRVAQLKVLPYKEYLRSTHWSIVRDWMLGFAYNRCQLCRSTAVLNVHHNSYDHKGEETRLDLIVLCKKCHEKHHGIKNGKKTWQKSKKNRKARRAAAFGHAAREMYSRANNRFR